MDKFWMVLGSGAPTYRHSTKESAEKEAERLAKSNNGQEFVVLEALKTVKAGVVQWEELGEKKGGWRNVSPVFDKIGCDVVYAADAPKYRYSAKNDSYKLMRFDLGGCIIGRSCGVAWESMTAQLKNVWVWEEDLPF